MAVPQQDQIFDSLTEAESYIRRYAISEGVKLVRKGGDPRRKYFCCDRRWTASCPYEFVLEEDRVTYKCKIYHLCLQHNSACQEDQRLDTASTAGTSVAAAEATSMSTNPKRPNNGQLRIGQSWSSEQAAISSIKSTMQRSGVAIWTEKRANGRLLRCRYSRSPNIQSSPGSSCPCEIVLSEVDENEDSISWEITSIHLEHNPGCRELYAKAKNSSSVSTKVRRHLSEDERADLDFHEGCDGDAGQSGPLTRSATSRTRVTSPTLPTPATSGFRYKRRAIVESDDEDEDPEQEEQPRPEIKKARPTSAEPAVKVKKEETGIPARIVIDLSSSSPEPPPTRPSTSAPTLDNPVKPVADAYTIFLAEHPEIATALQKEHLSDLSYLKKYAATKDRVKEAVMRMGEKHGIPIFDQVMVEDFIWKAIKPQSS